MANNNNEPGLADIIVGAATSVPTSEQSVATTRGLMAQQRPGLGVGEDPDYDLPTYIGDLLSTIRDERATMDYLKSTVDETRLDDYEFGLDEQAQRMIDSADTQTAYYQDGDVQQGSYYDIATRLSNDLMEDFGLSREQAAGFVGNLAHETGNFKFIQEIAPKAGKGGYGFAQWTGDRREAFEDWAKSNDLDINSYEANYGYLKKELTTRDNIIGSIGLNTIEKLKEAETVEDAAKLVSDYYLRPGTPMMNKRLSSARSVFSILK